MPHRKSRGRDPNLGRQIAPPVEAVHETTNDTKTNRRDCCHQSYHGVKGECGDPTSGNPKACDKGLTDHNSGNNSRNTDKQAGHHHHGKLKQEVPGGLFGSNRFTHNWGKETPFHTLRAYHDPNTPTGIRPQGSKVRPREAVTDEWHNRGVSFGDSNEAPISGTRSRNTHITLYCGCIPKRPRSPRRYHPDSS